MDNIINIIIMGIYAVTKSLDHNLLYYVVNTTQSTHPTEA